MKENSNMKPVIRTINLHKIFDESEVSVHAVNDVNFEVQEGEFTAVVGPSGSGKTTLLNMIGGLSLPTKGDVFIAGVKISDKSESERIDFRLNNIGFIFQSYNLIPVLSAIENAEFIMLLQKKSKPERRERILNLFRAVGLEGLEKRRPGKLSGGQQQRVAVVRALSSRPKFVLADEPTANLDSASTTKLLDIMAELNREENITFIFSTHDQRVINRARRIVTLEDGAIVSDEIRE